MGRAVGGRSFRTHNSTLYASGKWSMAADNRPPQKTAAGLAGIGPLGTRNTTPASAAAEWEFPEMSSSTFPATLLIRQYAVGLDDNTARTYASANSGPWKSEERTVVGGSVRSTCGGLTAGSAFCAW